MAGNLISQQIKSLLGGVSQQADKQRADSQMESQLNCYDNITFGKIKRPPTTHVSKLSSASWTDPYIFAVDRDESTKYHVIVEDGNIFVFDGITGQQYPVLTPQGTSYLTLDTPGAYTLPFSYKDSFDDANGTFLGSHTAPGGIGWTVLTGKNTQYAGATYTDNFEIESDAIDPLYTNTGANIGGYKFNQLPPTADYSVTLSVSTTAGSDQYTGTRIWARMIENGSSPATPSGYFVNIPSQWSIDGTTGITLCKQGITGSITVLHTYTTLATWPGSTTHIVGIQVAGTSISILLDGVAVYTTTDSTYTSAGQAAIDGYDEGNGSYMTYGPFALSYTETVTLPDPIQSGFRFTQIQDTTIITNQTVNVEPEFTAFSTVRNPEALVTVAIADYSTGYYLTINGITVGVATPGPTTAGSRIQLQTDQLAEQLYEACLANATLAAQFSFQLLGQEGTTLGASTFYLTRNDNQDFIISGNDSLNDQGLVVVKGTVQNIESLPARALNGMIVKVQPNPQDNIDVAYYIYDNFGSANLGGEWQETVAPGVLTTLNNLTMPWQLTRSGDVIAGFPAAGPIPLPSIYQSFSDPTYTGIANNEGGTRGGVIGDNSHYLKWTVTASGAYLMNFVYDVDASSLPAGYFITVVFNSTSGINKTFFYGGGTLELNIAEQFSTTYSGSDVWTATLYYSTGGTPGSGGDPELTKAQQSSVQFHGSTVWFGDASGDNLSEADPEGSSPYTNSVVADTITFSNIWEYAAGVQVNVAVVGSTTAHYTPPTAMNGTQLATALAANLTFTGYTLSAAGTTLTLTKASGPGAATVTYTWDNTEQFYNQNLDLAPGELVGFLFQDLTDGSDAIITANTTTTITFSAGLSGGITNSVRQGDICAVTGTAGQLFFVLQPINWTQRAAGDDTTNPFPSFTYNTINEVGFTSGRLVLFSGENMIASGSDDAFDFFRTTVTQLLDTDRIDVQGNSSMVSDWYAMVHWAEGVWLFAANVQAQLPVEPALSTSTVSIQPLTVYQSQPTLRPLAMDRNIYFSRVRSPKSAQPVTEILRYHRIRYPFQGFIADATTKAIPTYLQGTPTAMVGDPVLEILIVLTTAVPNQMYPYIFHYSEDQQLQMESWSTWEIDPDATILGIDMLSGVLGLVIQRADGVYLEYMDMQAALYEAQS